MGQLYGMVSWEVAMAELFSDAGYATGMFGKWYGIANRAGKSMYRYQFKFDGKAGIEAFIQEPVKGVLPTTVEPYTVEARLRIDSQINERATSLTQSIGCESAITR
jgi:arylsulfatase A-like enzyme